MKYRLVLLCLVLAGCATAKTPETRWVPRTDANQATDLAACEKEAASIDLRSVSTYGEGKYGPAAAMAQQIQNGDVNGITMKDVFNAVRDSCMIGKGWKQAE